jgi:hypothetical protein
MVGRRWQSAFVWGASLSLHGLGLGAAALLVFDFHLLPEERPYAVSQSTQRAECFLEAELRPRDLWTCGGRALRDDPDPQPCLEACDSLNRKLPALPAGNSEGGSPAEAHAPFRRCRSSVPSESALNAALRWLARHQNPDGGWSARGACCAGTPCRGFGAPEFEEGITSLAILAFLSAGYSSFSKDTFVDPAVPERTLCFGETVKKALRWLMDRQDAQGCIGKRGAKFMVNHALGTLALSEAFGMTAAAPLREPSGKAVEFLLAARNPGAGWRYGICDGESDTSVTGWALMALKSAELSEIPYSTAAVREAMTWLGGMVQAGDEPAIGYRPGNAPSTLPGASIFFADHPTLTAVGIDCAYLHPRTAAFAAGLLGTVLRQPPLWDSGQVDFHYWYFGMSAVASVTWKAGSAWNSWSSSLRTALVQHQRTSVDGCANGSWDPDEDRWGLEGGRVYATAINALSLMGLYCRRANVFAPNNSPISPLRSD